MDDGGQNLKFQQRTISGKRSAEYSPYAERYLQPFIPSPASREQEPS